jgi:hypothetical protein
VVLIVVGITYIRYEVVLIRMVIFLFFLSSQMFVLLSSILHMLIGIECCTCTFVHIRLKKKKNFFIFQHTDSRINRMLMHVLSHLYVTMIK